MSKETDGVIKVFKQGLWAVYIDCAADQKTTKDWGIMVRVAPETYYTSANLARSFVTNLYDKETYMEYKEALWSDEESLRNLLNMAVGYLNSKNWDGMSFWCSESSKRLLNRLGCRVEGDWVFLYRHYTF